MDLISKILIGRLAAKGIEVTCIPAFIRNMAYTIASSGATKPAELNKRMALLGWGDIEIDSYTLDLIMALFDARNPGPLTQQDIEIY